jgi:hypothetical protein
MVISAPWRSGQMPQMFATVRVTIDGEPFDTLTQYDLAPKSWTRPERLMPYHGKLIHAQWSGQSCRSPLSDVWPSESILPPENATGSA